MGKKSGLVGLAVLALPLVEIAALVVVGGALGVFRTLVFFLGMSVAGLYLFRLRLAMLASRGSRRTASAVLAVVGTLLMMLPGFVTGALGLLLQLAPIRALLAHRVTAQFTTSVGGVGARFGFQDPFGPQRPPRGDVIDTTIVDTPEPNSPDPFSSPTSELT
ncbi:MAG: FxsA family protein [Acidimicrobiales bacterium]|nr:FxsA family protein [Acidimicrobiales bacterium]